MNTTAWSKAAQTSAVVLIAVLGLAGLSGCEQQAYPSPSMEAQAGPPPPPPPAELMGAPEGPNAPPPAPSAYPPPGGPETGNLAPPPPGAGPEVAPPPGAQAPSAYPGPQQYAQNQPPYGAQPYAPPYPPPGYPAYGQPHPPVVISNAPIPNPVEPERHGGWRHHRHHEGQAAGPAKEEHALSQHHHHAAARQHRVWRHGHWVHEAAPSKPVAEHHHHYAAAHHQATAQHHTAVAHHGKAAAHHGKLTHHHVATHAAVAPVHHPAAVAHRHVQPAHHHAAAATHAAKVHHAAKPTPAVSPAHAHAVHHPHAVTHAAAPKITPVHHKTTPALKPTPLPQVTPITPSQAKRQAAQSASSGQTGNLTTASNGADQAARLNALQSAMTDLVNRRAQLKAPARFSPNQPVDVSLVLPADFAQSMQTEATKDNLSAAAATANLTAVLVGDGFAATPDQPQTQPLIAGQPVQFHWTVTAQPGAKGPLHADLSADLLGAAGPQNLALGSVSTIPATGGNTGRIIGISLLVIIAVIVIGWLSTRRRRPEPVGATRPRNNHHGDIETSV